MLPLCSALFSVLLCLSYLPAVVLCGVDSRFSPRSSLAGGSLESHDASQEAPPQTINASITLQVTAVEALKKTLLYPLVLSILLLLVMLFAPVYPVTATETARRCYALGGCVTMSEGKSYVYNSSIDIIGNGFKWESASERTYLGMDYDQTTIVYETWPVMLAPLLVVPLMGFLVAHLVYRIVCRVRESETE
jgi:hypothetical protein